jgi:hypothetical protein
MLEMSDLASSLKDVVSGLKNGLLIDLTQCFEGQRCWR